MRRFGWSGRFAAAGAYDREPADPGKRCWQGTTPAAGCPELRNWHRIQRLFGAPATQMGPFRVIGALSDIVNEAFGMLRRRGGYEYEDLLACGRGELFGPGNAQLPLPPMLMFDRIPRISETGGAHGKGEARAEFDIKSTLWFFDCHFKGDPVMPGCLGLDALWQLTGFFLGWLGLPGRGRALGVGEVKFADQVLPTIKRVVYGVDIKRVFKG